MAKYRKKPLVIEARGPLSTSEVVTTAHGRVRAEPGDYILVDPTTGDTWPIKPDIFAATYEPAGGHCRDKAEWQIIDPRDRTPDAVQGGSTHACTTHVGALLSDAPEHIIIPFTEEGHCCYVD